MKSVTDKKIFISYRVSDTAGETGRLVDALKQYFTDDQLFMDIENLEPGVDFTVAIERSLGACDVCLAVIGPRWTGPREGQPSRLFDDNDWVRLEVATALRRDARVVPVLVDGGVLPKPEELPDDLQPLLRRQTMEISNKRWRYDTDQLVQFLVKTVGIQPRRAAQQRMTAAPKKTKTWLYVAGGFVLAFLVLIIIGSMMQDEDKKVPEPQTGSATTGSATTTSNTEPPSGGSGTEKTYSSTDVSGTWQEVDEGLTATFVLTQSGEQIDAQVRMNGEPIGSGTGTISGRDVELNVPLFGVATNLHGALSSDGSIISGTYTMPATGAVQPFKLARK